MVGPIIKTISLASKAAKSPTVKTYTQQSLDIAEKLAKEPPRLYKLGQYQMFKGNLRAIREAGKIVNLRRKK